MSRSSEKAMETAVQVDEYFGFALSSDREFAELAEIIERGMGLQNQTCSCRHEERQNESTAGD